MNLNHPTQHSSNSNPSAVALRAATLSYDKSVTTITSPTEDSSNRSATKKGCVINKISTASSPIGKVGTGDKGHLPAIQQRKLKDKMQEHQYGPSVSKTPLLQKSSSMVVGDAAAAEFRTRIAKGGTKVGKGDDKPATGTVDTCSRLLRDGVALEEYSPTLSEDVSPKHSRLPDLSVDSTSLEDISSLKNLFEKGATICAPKHIRPVSENPSLTAAIIATQVSSSNPTHSSSRGSPILKQSSKPAQGISTPLNFDNRSSSHITAHEPSPVLLDSKQSEIYETSGLSDHKNALLAATLSVKPKIPRTPLKKTQPPRPPPPRRAHDGLKVPNGKILGVEDNSDALSIHSARTGFSKYDTARSSVSLQPSLSHSIISPIPKRRLSLGNIPHQMAGGKSLVVSGATLSTASPHIDPVHGSCRQPLPVSQHLTGDAVIAASLAPSHVNSPAPRKRPAPPAPRRSRRKSLPSPPKKGFRETMGKPRYSPAEASPQRKMPNLVKHKHSERERRRWRPFITDVERRRYEGLWAANKGLLLATCDSKSEGPSPYSPSLQQRKSHEPDSSQSQHMWSSTPGYTEDLSDYVHSLVARDIWTRSRLPLNHLADIWDLVDRSMKGRLSRDEFVVEDWVSKYHHQVARVLHIAKDIRFISSN
ncbi:uncharacterized protein LAJ45_10012 [Morchella importuna]|uniref:uncharacterized protein n=1 Tax=Morchella importuna TaxID=1174673 RepID=UPI001E8EC46E|nr:uncharacterized protein LAJ45_10012 [Morchella importuna]KAH8145870.1 hypothetical protein LAJ45_10012 [Morchella importuna]